MSDGAAMVIVETIEEAVCLSPGGIAEPLVGNWFIPIAWGVRGELGYWFGGDGAALGSTG